jgi:hypothetical protein
VNEEGMKSGRLRLWRTEEMRRPAREGYRPNPKYPRPEDRFNVESLAASLSGADLVQADFLLEQSPELLSWVLVEHFCHESSAPDLEAGRSLERARLAVRIARKMPGTEAWQARVQAYAEAHLGRALRRAGEATAAALARTAAEVLWDLGADPRSLLSREKFLQALGAVGSGEP